MTKEESHKNQQKDLIVELTAFFKGLEVEVIDDVVAKAKKQAIAIAEAIKVRHNSLTKLFNDQMKTLKLRECPQAILKEFQHRKGEVLDKAIKMNIPEGHIPFVPVIPHAYMGIHGLMPMVRDDEKVGSTHLNPSEITDNENVPKNLYFIYDIIPGEDTLCRSPKDAEKIIKKQDRLCHILDEDIAICVHTRVFLNDCFWSTGSRYRCAYVPYILFGANGPSLDYGKVNDVYAKCKSASCHSRF